MGLDYSYVLIIEKRYEEKVYDYIRETGNISYNNCSEIYFAIDSFILKYLEGGYDYSPHYDKDKIDMYLIPDNKARIGCIYLSKRDINSDTSKVALYFTAATTDMSLLFKDSISIKRWFIDLSRKVDSAITYIDLEYEGQRIVYFLGEEINIEFKGENHLNLGKNKFLGLMNDFAKYVEFNEEQ